MNEDAGSPILVDAPGGEGRFERSILERLGHPVVACGGPGADDVCPLLCDAACPKFDEAHGIVFELDLERPQHRAIVERYRELVYDVPLRVVVTPDQRERYTSLLHDIEVWDHLPTVAELDGFAASVEAVDRSSRPSGAEPL